MRYGSAIGSLKQQLPRRESRDLAHSTRQASGTTTLRAERLIKPPPSHGCGSERHQRGIHCSVAASTLMK